MNIQLISTKTVFIQLISIPELDNDYFHKVAELKNEDSFTFDLEVNFPQEANDRFTVLIKSELTKKDKFTLQTIFLAEFLAEHLIHDKFKDSEFPYVNAPAIAYPFFRAMVANTLTNSGIEVEYLPSVNFQALYDKQKNQD